MAIRIFDKLLNLLDVNSAGVTDGDVPTFDSAQSKFTMGPSAAGGGGHSVTLGGNTAGALALISTGTMTLAGGNGITLSQAGNAVTISGGAGAAETQTAISGISASNTLYTSGTVRITGVGGGVTVSSNTGQRIDISVAAPVAQSVQPETQTFIGGLSASDTLYTSGSVRITGVGGGITVSSNTGQRIDLSVAAPVAQTVQTQNVVDLTLAGNTAGALALISSGTATFAGGNNITLSQAGNAITISGPNVGGAQTGISGIANSETTFTSGTVSLSELGAITIRSTTGNQFQLSVNPQSVQVETQTFVAGISASDTLYTSGNVRLTGVGGGVTVSSNTGQRVDISVAAQSVQPETQTFIGGISASDTLYTSGSVRITGVGGGITVSSNTGQRIDLSVAAQSVQPETQTFVAGIQNSQTTYTSGTVNLSVVAGNLTIRSTTGQAFQFSASQTVQTQGVLSAGVSTGGNTAGNTTVNTGSRFVLVGTNMISLSQTTGAGATTISINATQSVQPETQTFVGGIANSQTTYTSGTVSLSELGAVTIRSTTGNQFQISVNSQSVQPETQTFIAGISASDTLYTSGNVRFTGVGGGVTVSSNTGQRVDISVAAQSVQPETQTFVGGIGNSQTTYTSGTVNLSVNGGLLTIRSTTGNAFQFSISQSVQAETQTAISGIANSQTTYTSGTVSLSELGAITIRSTTGNQFQLSVNSQTVQTQNLHNVTLSGNSTSAGAGYIQVSSGTLTLAGGNNITLSQNGNAVTISAAGGPETQTAISGIANSQTTYSSGTVSLSELGAITIRSTTGNQFQFSVNSQTVQTQNMVAVSATNTLYSSGTVLLTGSNMITVKSSGAGQTIILDATQSVQTQDVLSIGVSTGGNTAGNTTVNTGSRFVVIGSGNLTASMATAAGATSLNLSVATQTVQTQSNIAGLYDGANSISTGTIRVTDANGVTFSVNGQTLSASVNQSISMFAVSNTTQSSSGTAHKSALSFGGAGIASVGVTGGSVVISVPSGGGAGDGGVFAGVSTMGNTAGSTGTVSTGNFVLVGSNNISLSQSTGAAGSAATITINGPASSSLSAVDPLSISTNGSTISFLAPATSSLSATGQVSISTNASTISIGVPNPLLSYRWIEDRLLMGATQGVGASAATQTTVTAWVQPLTIPTDLAFNNLLLAAHNSFSSNTTSISSVNYSYSMGASVGFYTLTGSTMSRVTSFSNSLAYTNATAANVTGMSLGATVGYGGSSTTKSTGGGANMTAIMSSINSVRQVPMNWTTLGNTLTRGQYWAVVAFSQLTAGAAQASLSQVGFVSNFSIIGSAINPPEFMQNTASVTSPYPFLGQATLVNSSNELMPSSFATSKITTATAIANSTKFQSIWMRIYSSHSN